MTQQVCFREKRVVWCGRLAVGIDHFRFWCRSRWAAAEDEEANVTRSGFVVDPILRSTVLVQRSNNETPSPRRVHLVGNLNSELASHETQFFAFLALDERQC